MSKDLASAAKALVENNTKEVTNDDQKSNFVQKAEQKRQQTEVEQNQR